MSIEKWKILQVAGRLLKYAQLAALSDKFGYGYVSPPPEDPEQGDEPTQQRVRFLQWFGFRSRPVVNGGEAIVAAPRGGTTNAVALAADHLGYGPTDLKEGESAVYDKSGSVIHLFEDGSLSVTAKGGAVVTLDKDGGFTIVIGTQSNGQGGLPHVLAEGLGHRVHGRRMRPVRPVRPIRPRSRGEARRGVGGTPGGRLTRCGRVRRRRRRPRGR